MGTLLLPPLPGALEPHGMLQPLPWRGGRGERLVLPPT